MQQGKRNRRNRSPRLQLEESRRALYEETLKRDGTPKQIGSEPKG
jgi:hypothetical protein